MCHDPDDALTILDSILRPRETRLLRHNGGQTLGIPTDFEMPGDRVLIRREGTRLILELVSGSSGIVELLAKWRTEAPLGPEDQFPEIADKKSARKTNRREIHCAPSEVLTSRPTARPFADCHHLHK